MIRISPRGEAQQPLKLQGVPTGTGKKPHRLQRSQTIWTTASERNQTQKFASKEHQVMQLRALDAAGFWETLNPKP
jgi:hypothetical protein